MNIPKNIFSDLTRRLDVVEIVLLMESIELFSGAQRFVFHSYEVNENFTTLMFCDNHYQDVFEIHDAMDIVQLIGLLVVLGTETYENDDDDDDEFDGNVVLN